MAPPTGTQVHPDAARSDTTPSEREDTRTEAVLIDTDAARTDTTPGLGDHPERLVHLGTDLTPKPTPQDADADELSDYELAGARGANPRLHENWADELLRKGAIHDGDWVAVTHAEVIGTRPDGTLAGEATIRRTPFEPSETVRFAELAIPTDSYVKHLNRMQWPATASVPSHFAEEISRRQEVIDACPIDIYCSSINPAWGWPHKLMSYYEARPGAAETCDTLMIDSGVNRWGSPDDVLEAAANVDADLVFATDVTGMENPDNRDHNDAMPSTDDDDGINSQEDAAMEGIARFMQRAFTLDIADRVVLPVQRPYGAFLDRLEARGYLDAVGYVAVGGLLSIPDVDDRIDALHTVRNRVGAATKIHALAPGTDLTMLRELRDSPGLVDSLDVSTPEVAPGNDKLPDASWNQDRHFFPRGDHTSTVRAAYSVGIALQLAQMLSPLCNAEDTFGELLDDNDDDADTASESEPDPQAQIHEWAANN